MGRPVLHFEVTGRDGERLRSFYSELFDWKINADNPMRYGVVAREDNLNADGIGIGVSAGPDGYPGHVTIYVEVPDVEATMARAEALGASRLIGPDEVMEGVQIGLFHDPEGHLIGVIRSEG